MATYRDPTPVLSDLVMPERPIGLGPVAKGGPRDAPVADGLQSGTRSCKAENRLVALARRCGHR